MEEDAKPLRLTDFAPSIVHDIKNILAIIEGYLALLELEINPDNTITTGYMESIKLEIKRLSNLASDISDISTGGIKLHRELIYLDSFCVELKRSAKLMKDDKNIKIKFMIENSIEIIGDNDRLFRVFINLIKNAIDAIDKKGKIYFKVKRIKDEVSFMIYDTGKGISATDIPKVFDIYFTNKRLGTGLGLAIVKAIIAAHGGRVFLRSTHGRYTCFIIRLPIYE